MCSGVMRTVTRTLTLAAHGVGIDAQVISWRSRRSLRGAVGGEARHRTAQGDAHVGVVGIGQRDGHARVVGEEASLGATEGGIDDDVLAVKSDPHRRHVRRTVQV